MTEQAGEAPHPGARGAHGDHVTVIAVEAHGRFPPATCDWPITRPLSLLPTRGEKTNGVVNWAPSSFPWPLIAHRSGASLMLSPTRLGTTHRAGVGVGVGVGAALAV